MEFSITIREVQPSDLESIWLIGESNSDSQDEISREIIEERIRNHADTFLLASLDDQGIAYVSGTVFTDTLLSKWALEKEPEQPINDSYILIGTLAVDPDYQGQGFGTLLLAALKEVAHQQNRPGIYLLCEDELITYFEMNGFVEQGIVDGERSSEIAFLMCWHNPYYQEEI